MTRSNEELLAEAAAPTLEQIREDCRAASAQLRPVLDELELRLFDPGLTVEQLTQLHGANNTTLGSQFHSELGFSPSAYIRGCRLDTADRLLRQTALTVSVIAHLVCYRTAESFSRSFFRWSGLRPSELRRRARVDPSFLPESEEVALRGLRRTLRRELQSAESEVLRQRLSTLFAAAAEEVGWRGGSGRVPTPSGRAELEHADLGRAAPLPALDSSFDSATLEQSIAEAAWRHLRSLPEGEQEPQVREWRVFTTPALFHRIRAEILPAARNRCREGVRLAELALASLDGLTDDAPRQSEKSHLRALAWIDLGNARRLAFDLPGAELALDQAEAFLEQPSLELEATLHRVRGALRWFQRRFDDALRELGKAETRLRQLDRPAALAAVLLHQGIVYEEAGRADEAVVILQGTLPRVGLAAHPQLELALLTALGWCHLRAGHPAEAENLLPRMRRVALTCGEIARLQVQVLDGLTAGQLGDLETAEQALVAARDGFAEAGSAGHAALADLELAGLYLEQKRPEACSERLAAVLPLFDSLASHREALVSQGLLRTAIERREASPNLLRQVRDTLVRLGGLAHL